MRIVCFVVAAVFVCCVGCVPFTPSHEVDALVDLYKTCGGQEWLNNENWLVGDPCTNKWFGVTCDIFSSVSFL